MSCDGAAAAGEVRDRAASGADRERREEEAQREHLPHGEDDRRHEPEDPRLHVRD